MHSRLSGDIPNYSVPGARTQGDSQKCLCVRLSHSVQLSVTPWTVARQAPPSMGFSRQEDWSGVPFPSPGGLPDPGTGPKSPVAPALAGGFFTTEAPGKSSKMSPDAESSLPGGNQCTT